MTLNKRRLLAYTLSAACLITLSSAQAAGDPVKGKAKSVTCAACHGAAGISINPLWPNLAGQHAAYLEKQIKAFKSGERKDPSMAPMVAALTPQDIADLAAYFSSLKK